jgi:predicted Fe-Mo cluster-binding NifX family protein
MITAIPVNDNRISNHFTKAQSLLFIDEQGVEISRHRNPALNGGCADKRKMLDLISGQGAERVLVRNIGEQMLGKLLGKNLEVFQVDRCRQSLQELVQDGASTRALTHASQGRASVNHEAKGGKCCHEHEGEHAHEGGSSCHEHEGEHAHKGSCCQSESHDGGHAHPPLAAGGQRRRGGGCCHRS